MSTNLNLLKKFLLLVGFFFLHDPTFIFADGKKIIELSKIPNGTIELPNQIQIDYGESIVASLTTKMMQTGRYEIFDEGRTEKLTLESRQIPQTYENTYSWTSHIQPAARVLLTLDAMSFRVGRKGDRMYYGFDERLSTPFNDGKNRLSNEFPLKQNSAQPSWFYQSFEKKGTAPFDSQSGLDLGDGFNLDYLFAWLTVKYASYQSELHMTLKAFTPASTETLSQSIKVKGNGFFFDIAGAYQGYSAGIGGARGDAMDQAVKSAILKSFDVIDPILSTIPLVANVDYVLPNGDILLGTGIDSGVPAGTRYSLLEDESTLIEVKNSLPSGSVAKLVQGSLQSVRPGSLAKEYKGKVLKRQFAHLNLRSGNSNEHILPEQTLTLPSTVLPYAPLLEKLVPQDSRFQAFLKSLKESVFLIYRITRYFMYDQAYHRTADTWGTLNKLPSSGEKWAKQIAFDSASLRDVQQDPEKSTDTPVTIAVIDSGIDYNHPVLHDSLWINPNSFLDSNGHADRYGWDFISNDSHPYDDGYHGTQIASLISTIAPHVKIMPLKVFNPWGITNSASIYAAFKYATDHHAHLIVCAWSTPILSKAIEMGVAYAREQGVLVIAAAGDMGHDLSVVPEYPAVLSAKYENVLTVTGVDTSDQLLNTTQTRANYGAGFIQLAAPSANIVVAEPRGGKATVSSTGLSAALVAGAIARNTFSSGKNTLSYQDQIREVLSQSVPIDSLKPYVKNGIRLRIIH